VPLAVCATPIGNLEDVTLRVLRGLAEADLVLCEDTRHTRTLLQRHGIKARVESRNRETPQGYQLSLSVGATRTRAEGTMLADLLAKADTALYEQKRGRGRPQALSR